MIRLFRILFIVFLAFFFLCERGGFAQNFQENLPYNFFGQRDCRPSVYEIGRSLQFFPQNLPEALSVNFYPLLLWNYCQPGEPEKVIRTRRFENLPKNYRENMYRSKNPVFLRTGNQKLAEELTGKISREEKKNLELQMQSPERVDPEKAAIYSTYFPGSGFLLSENYTSFFVSAGLNFGFFYGAGYFFLRTQYGLSLFFLFFNIQWYQGGIRGSRESAEKYNRKIEAQVDKEEMSLWSFELKLP